MPLNGSRLTVLVEIAFGHFWENCIQNVHAATKIIFQEFDAKRKELARQKFIRQVNLDQQIEQIQKFTEYQCSREFLVDANVLVKVVSGLVDAPLNYIIAGKYIVFKFKFSPFLIVFGHCNSL